MSSALERMGLACKNLPSPPAVRDLGQASPLPSYGRMPGAVALVDRRKQGSEIPRQNIMKQEDTV